MVQGFQSHIGKVLEVNRPHVPDAPRFALHFQGDLAFASRLSCKREPEGLIIRIRIVDFERIKGVVRGSLQFQRKVLIPRHRRILLHGHADKSVVGKIDRSPDVVHVHAQSNTGQRLITELIFRLGVIAIIALGPISKLPRRKGPQTEPSHTCYRKNVQSFSDKLGSFRGTLRSLDIFKKRQGPALTIFQECRIHTHNPAHRIIMVNQIRPAVLKGFHSDNGCPAII